MSVDMRAAADPKAATPARAAPWQIEDERFWENDGKRIAWRNLWISVPCLASAFAVWMAWSIITVQMANLGFPFTETQLFTLASIAGLAGATLRIPNSFLVALAGGRNTVALTTGLLLFPTAGLAVALRDPKTPFAIFAVLAALSGIGGGNFASSMSNISLFFPKRMQGTALGINAGLGNLGVSVMQVLLPLVAAAPVFGALGGAGAALPKAVGAAPAGTLVYVQNCGAVWVPILVVLTLAAAVGMSNRPVGDVGSGLAASAKILGLTALGFLATAFGLYLMLGLGLAWWIVLPATAGLALVLFRFVPGRVRGGIDRQLGILKSRHTWVMTILYLMTFGSFIGFSNSFPLLIKVIFSKSAAGLPLAGAPNPFAYAWLGPLVGSAIRPIGGWLSDKLGGARVTQATTVLMIVAAVGVAYVVRSAQSAESPLSYFPVFLALFLVLFVATGIGNGSTFRMIPFIFEPAQAGPVLGWTSAIAAYGSFIIPQLFKQEVKKGTVHHALLGFAAYYVVCLVLNWWFYARKNASVRC